MGLVASLWLKFVKFIHVLVQKATNLSCSGKSVDVSQILSILQPEYKTVWVAWYGIPVGAKTIWVVLKYTLEWGR